MYVCERMHRPSPRMIMRLMLLKPTPPINRPTDQSEPAARDQGLGRVGHAAGGLRLGVPGGPREAGAAQGHRHHRLQRPRGHLRQGKGRTRKMSGRAGTTPCSCIPCASRPSSHSVLAPRALLHPRTALRLQGGHLGFGRAHVHPALGLPPVRPHERRGRRPDRAAHRQGTFVCLFSRGP